MSSSVYTAIGQLMKFSRHPFMISQTRLIMEQIKTREWGLMILDEVHVCPAE